MNQIVTKGIALSRTDFGEADRIVTMLTPDQGKLRLIAKGVRKVKSRLAGGIELFSISDITFIRGRGDISTLVSARLQMHYGDIIKNIDRVQLGYELIKLLNTVTEDQPEPEYFGLLQEAFAALNDPQIDHQLITAWFNAQLIKLAGHSPNLYTDTSGQDLAAGKRYAFDFDAMSFELQPGAHFKSDHIKLLRLLFGDYTPQALNRVEQADGLLKQINPTLLTIRTTFLKV